MRTLPPAGFFLGEHIEVGGCANLPSVDSDKALWSDSP
jgi:hypothetical protein